MYSVIKYSLIVLTAIGLIFSYLGLYSLMGYCLLLIFGILAYYMFQIIFSDQWNEVKSLNTNCDDNSKQPTYTYTATPNKTTSTTKL